MDFITEEASKCGPKVRSQLLREYFVRSNGISRHLGKANGYIHGLVVNAIIVDDLETSTNLLASSPLADLLQQQIIFRLGHADSSGQITTTIAGGKADLGVSVGDRRCPRNDRSVGIKATARPAPRFDGWLRWLPCRNS